MNQFQRKLIIINFNENSYRRKHVGNIKCIYDEIHGAIK